MYIYIENLGILPFCCINPMHVQRAQNSSHVISGVSWADVFPLFWMGGSVLIIHRHRAKLQIFVKYFFFHCCRHIFVARSQFFTLDQYMIPSKNVHLESPAGMLRWTMFSCSFFEGQACKHTRCHRAVVASCAEVFISQWDKPPGVRQP